MVVVDGVGLFGGRAQGEVLDELGTGSQRD